MYLQIVLVCVLIIASLLVVTLSLGSRSARSSQSTTPQEAESIPALKEQRSRLATQLQSMIHLNGVLTARRDTLNTERIELNKEGNKAFDNLLATFTPLYKSISPDTFSLLYQNGLYEFIEPHRPQIITVEHLDYYSAWITKLYIAVRNAMP